MLGGTIQSVVVDALTAAACRVRRSDSCRCPRRGSAPLSSRRGRCRTTRRSALAGPRARGATAASASAQCRTVSRNLVIGAEARRPSHCGCHEVPCTSGFTDAAFASTTSPAGHGIRVRHIPSAIPSARPSSRRIIEAAMISSGLPLKRVRLWMLSQSSQSTSKTQTYQAMRTCLVADNPARSKITFRSRGSRSEAEVHAQDVVTGCRVVVHDQRHVDHVEDGFEAGRSPTEGGFPCCKQHVSERRMTTEA